jgi:hypothetical protein
MGAAVCDVFNYKMFSEGWPENLYKKGLLVQEKQLRKNKEIEFL